MNNITIIGAGFSALTAVNTLRKIDKKVHIDLVSPIARFNYYPSSIWIPTDLRKPEDIVVNLNLFFSRLKVNFHESEAIGIRDHGRTVILSSKELVNDGLIICSGGQYINALPGIEHTFNACAGPYEVYKFRNRLRSMTNGVLSFGFSGNPNEPAAMRGGPTFEFLFGVDEWLRKRGVRNNFDLVFFSSSDRPGQRMGMKVVDALIKEMKRRDIKTILGKKILGFESSKVVFDGYELTSNLIMFTPGMTGKHWFKNTDLKLSPGGFLSADENCRVIGGERVYVAGDSGSYPGPDWLPKQAHMADLQAKCAAKNLMAELNGKPVKNAFKVELICIVDSYAKGTFVFRNERFTILLPMGRFGHWLKNLFEKLYLKKYR